MKDSPAAVDYTCRESSESVPAPFVGHSTPSQVSLTTTVLFRGFVFMNDKSMGTSYIDSSRHKYSLVPPS